MTETATPQRRSGEHHKTAEVRERILRATVKVATERGYHGLTIARVSAESMLPAGSVYWHFESKDLLLLAALELGFQDQRTALDEQAPFPGESVDEYVRRTVAISAAKSDGPWGFWRIGVTLLADSALPEVETVRRFREIRVEVRALYASWWRQVLPPHSLHGQPGVPEAIADFVLAVHDGQSMALAAGEAPAPRMLMLARALSSMVASDEPWPI